MNKYLRTHGKKIMAILGVLLMIAFALPSATQMGRQGTANAGTMYDGSVTLDNREYSRLISEWNFLKDQQRRLSGPQVIEYILGIGNRSSQQDLLMSDRQMWGRVIYQEIDSNPELFVLLVKEAQRLGITASSDAVNTDLVELGYSPDTDPELYNAMKQALGDLMAVSAAADRASNVVKVSRPVVETRKGQLMQEVAVNVVEYDAKDVLAQVPAPTPQQIQEQFDKYKNVTADASPNGFGYKYPNRVKYEAIVIRKDEVKKGIAPVELDQVYEYYLRNKNAPEWTTTTAPSTRPQDAFTLDTGPTTRPMTFQEAKDKITKTLTDQRVDELTEKIRDAVAGAMKADYAAYSAAVAKSAAPPASSVGVPYNSPEYFAKLRDKVQADHKVTLTIEREEGWQTPKSLEESKLGKESFATESGVSFARYMTGLVTAFLDEEQRKAMGSRPDLRPVALWEPTPFFRDTKDDVLLARATAADASHVPASLDEVKDKVAADVKEAAAYEKAKQAAQAAVDAAKSGKWLQSVANEQKKKMITTGLFSSPRAGVPVVPGYDTLKGSALRTFIGETFKLLAQVPRTGTAPRPATTRSTSNPTSAPISTALKDHPVGLIELPAEGKVLVAEIDQLKPSWTKDREPLYNSIVGGQERAMGERDLRLQWFRYENVIERTGYKMPEGREPKSPRRQPIPINPFTGTATPLSNP